MNEKTIEKAAKAFREFLEKFDQDNPDLKIVKTYKNWISKGDKWYLEMGFVCSIAEAIFSEKELGIE